MELLGYVGAINEQGIDVSVEQYPYSAGCTNITSSFFDNGFPGPGMIWIATQVVRRHRTHPRHTAPTGLHRARHHCSANAFQPFLSLSALDGVWRPGGADSSDIFELPSGDAAVGPGRVDHSAWPTGLRGAAAYHPPPAHTPAPLYYVTQELNLGACYTLARSWSTGLWSTPWPSSHPMVRHTYTHTHTHTCTVCVVMGVLDPPFGRSLGGWNVCGNFKTTSC